MSSLLRAKAKCLSPPRCAINTINAMPSDLYINEAVTIPGEELSWTSVRASGPGGQNVNKVSSKVLLRFDLRGSRALSGAVKARLRANNSRRLDADGQLMLSSQRTRNREQNLQDARERLAELIRQALVPPKRRRATKPTRGSQRRRLEAKRKQSDKKRNRGRVSRSDD